MRFNKRIGRFGLLGMMLVCLVSAQAQAKENYKVMGNSLPPFGIANEMGLEGYSVDLFKMVVNAAGLNQADFEVKRVPFKRIYKELLNGDNRIGLHIARTAQREDLFKWVGPYYEINMGLIGKKVRDFQAIQLSQSMPYSIGVVSNTVPHQILLKMDVPESGIEDTPRPQEVIKMLDGGRVDLLAHIYDVSSYLMREMKIDANQYEIKHSLAKGRLYFALSKGISDEIVQKMQNGLVKVQKSSAFLNMLQRYYLENQLPY